MLAENSVKSGRKSFVELLINPLEEQEAEGAVDIVEGMMKVSGLPGLARLLCFLWQTATQHFRWG